MRTFGFVLLLLCLLIGSARLFTGVTYLSDEPTALLVLKQRPALWIERGEDEDRPFSQQLVLDSDEPVLFYGGLYVWLMQSAPVLMPGLAGGGILLLAASNRRGRKRTELQGRNKPPTLHR